MWNDPVTTTPSIVQVDFGAWGQNLPGDGETYCGPTSLVMGLYWLSGNGFSQLAPAVYNGQEDPAATNLELVIAGLVETSSESGTFTDGILAGMAAYLSACGIAPDQYTLASTDNPDLDWLATQLAPNVAADPQSIVLAIFSVGWYSPKKGQPKVLLNNGGHVLAPLTVDQAAGTVTLNNAYPASFENVPNDPSENPQTVQIEQLPSGLSLQYLNLPSQDYAQVISGNKGNGTSYAILWGGQAWALSPSVLPSTPGYTPATWTLDGAQTINTNGATFTVLAPLAGAGGFTKNGEGVLALTGPNQTTGANAATGGAWSSPQSSGTPFGAGPMTLDGGVLQLAAGGTAATVTIASAAGATLTIGDGGGMLQLAGNGLYTVTVGGNTDGATPNIVRTTAGTFVVAPGAGIGALGAGQSVLVAGTKGNLPTITNGIVAPYIVGQDNDSAGSAAFLTYGPAGFQSANTVSSASVPIKKVKKTAIYDVVDSQTISSGASVQVAALALNGGSVEGYQGDLQVGNQAAGEIAGIVMNGGSIASLTLSFGDAEAVIYSSANDSGAAIGAGINGTGGLTVFGPGTLNLTADNSASLSGPVSVNGGTLLASGAEGSATGAGDVLVNGGAVLEVSGIVGGAVDVGQSGTLYLNGGTVQGNVTIEAIGESSADPGGILQGGGTIAGTTVVGGVIQSGPQAAVLQFTGPVTMADAAFSWRLQALVDNQQSGPGVDWNALQFGSPDSVIGTQSAPVSLFLDFSAIDGDPDSGDVFWRSSHAWTIMTFPANQGSAWWSYGNFYYESGSFDTAWDYATGLACLTWTPAASPQSLDDRRAAAAEARAAARQRGLGFFRMPAR